jgi:glycosyltransferase involved in cell wall biosynthesis
MKKILYIEANKDGTVGGSYYSLLSLVQGLNKSKYEPHIMFCQDNILIPEFKKTASVYINDFKPSYNTRAKSIRDYMLWPYHLVTELIVKQPMLRHIIREIQPDLVHLNDGYAAMHEWMLACYLNHIRVIAHDRGTRYPCSCRTKLFVRALDAIISVSDSYKNNAIRQNLKAKRIRRVHNGLDIQTMLSGIEKQSVARISGEFSLEGYGPIVGIIGNIDRWKGQHIVLQAIKEVKRFYPDIKCLIVGSVCKGAEVYKTELDKYIKDNDLGENFIFTGFRKDIPNILNVLDILLHASIEPEPFGRVILEGMAACKPIIAINAGGIPEIVINRETGILVPINDYQGIAENIHYFLSNPDKAKEMGQKGKERLINEFSNEKTVREIEKIYEEIFN